MLKNEYTPNAFCRKDEEGKHIPMGNRADEAAKYLESKQWAEVEDKSDQRSSRKLKYGAWDMRTDPPDRVEVYKAIAKLKRENTEGTDGVSINLYKELTSDNRQEVVQVLEEWWQKAVIPEEELLARVVLIFC